LLGTAPKGLGASGLGAGVLLPSEVDNLDPGCVMREEDGGVPSITTPGGNRNNFGGVESREFWGGIAKRGTKLCFLVEIESEVEKSAHNKSSLKNDFYIKKKENFIGQFFSKI